MVKQMMILTVFILLFNYYLTLSREPPESWVNKIRYAIIRYVQMVRFCFIHLGIFSIHGQFIFHIFVNFVRFSFMRFIIKLSVYGIL